MTSLRSTGWIMGEGWYITLFSPSDVTAFHRIVQGKSNIDGKWKWNESGFRPPLYTYRLNWAWRASWGWWDDWDDTVLQTQDSKFEPWLSEAEHATSRSRRLPTILTFTRGWGRNIFVSFKPPRPGTEPRTQAWKAAVQTTTLGPPPQTLMEKGTIYETVGIKISCGDSVVIRSFSGSQSHLILLAGCKVSIFGRCRSQGLCRHHSTGLDTYIVLTLTTLKYFCINHADQRVFLIWNHHS